MPELDTTTLEKIEDLRAISAGWTQPLEVYQFVTIYWQSGTKHYAPMDLSGVSPSFPLTDLEVKLQAGSFPNYFLPTGGSSALSDKEIKIEIWDSDGEFADLAYAEGEGIKSEVLFWFPAVELLLSCWTGHLRTSEDSDAYVWRGVIANGFRSPKLPMPKRRHYRACQATYGKKLDTQDEINRSGCPHNAHLPEGERSLPVIGNTLHADCPRRSPQDCIDRGVPPEFHLSHHSISVTAINNQTSGSTLYSRSQGNETNLKKPVRVVMGTRRVRNMEVLAFARHYNNNTPDRGFFEALYECCHGPIQAIYGARIFVGSLQNANPQHYFHLLGTPGQPAINPQRLTTHAYSYTALFNYNFGWVHPGTVDPSGAKGEAVIVGLNDIRVYSDEDTFTVGYTSQRAWHITHALANRIWGHGLDYERLNIGSFIDSANWGASGVTFTDPFGATYSYTRGESNVEMDDRTVQQQLEDLCREGRLSRPFEYQGKICIQPIRALTEEELENVPVFTDEGVMRNIIFEDGQSTLKRSEQSDLDIPNRIEATFNDVTKDWFEETAQPIEDVDQQLAAGRVLGDTSRREVTEKYSFASITNAYQVTPLMYWLLWFGEFGEGGLKNNLQISFKCWFLDALTLHEFKVIKVVSSQLDRYGFEYFQIKNIEPQNNLHYRITAQAFAQEALAEFESVYVPPDPGDPDDPPMPGEPPMPGDPCRLGIGDIRFAENVLEIDLMPC